MIILNLKFVYILIFILPQINLLRAQEIEFNGFVEVDHISYIENKETSKVNSRNRGILQLELRSNFSDQSSIFSAVEFRADQSDLSRNRVYLDEAYIDLFLDDFDFRFGKQIIIWGKADGFNPTDNITPWDFSDILDTDDERIGVVALKANYYIGNWTLEGIIVPTFTPSVLPTENSRWFPTFPETVRNPIFPGAGPPILKAFYEFQNPILPDENFSNAQYAGKISSTFSGWDVSVSYYYGWDDLPSFYQSQYMTGDSLFLEIQPVYQRRKVLGIDFSTTFGKWGIRGEAAYFITADPNGTNPEIDDPYFQYVMGIDRTFSNLIGENNLFVLIQWIQEIPKYYTVYRNDDLNHVFQKSFTARMEYEFGAFSKIIIEGVYNIKNEDYYISPAFNYNIFDGVELKLSGEIFGGKADSFFGNYRDNNRVQVKIKYSF
jgi:hypothetical protein